jgi:hypothetical protein
MGAKWAISDGTFTFVFNALGAMGAKNSHFLSTAPYGSPVYIYLSFKKTSPILPILPSELILNGKMDCPWIAHGLPMITKTGKNRNGGGPQSRGNPGKKGP